MSYLVFCTFDLKSATSTDYATAYAELEKLGLSKVAKSTVIPTTSVMGFFDGQEAGQVRDAMRDRISAAFSARKLKSEIFVVVGGNWAWGAANS